MTKKKRECYGHDYSALDYGVEHMASFNGQVCAQSPSADLKQNGFMFGPFSLILLLHKHTQMIHTDQETDRQSEIH